MPDIVSGASPQPAAPPVDAPSLGQLPEGAQVRAALVAALVRSVSARRILVYAFEPAVGRVLANTQTPLRFLANDEDTDELQRLLGGEEREVRRRSEMETLALWPADLVILEIAGEEFAGSPDAAHAQVAKGGFFAILGPPVQNDDVDLECLGIFCLDQTGSGLTPAPEGAAEPLVTLFNRKSGPEIPKPMSGIRRVSTFTAAMDSVLAPDASDRAEVLQARVEKFHSEEEAFRGWMGDGLVRVAERVAKAQPASAARLMLSALELKRDARLEARVAELTKAPAPSAREWGRFLELACYLMRRGNYSAPSLSIITGVLDREPTLTGRALSCWVRGLRAKLSQRENAEDEEELKRAEAEVARLREKTKGLPPIMFFSLGNGGASAIHPVLHDLLTGKFHYDSFVNPAYSMFIEAAFFEGPNPLFNWTHHALRNFPEVARRPEQKVLCLYRDPRDVVVSHVKQGYADGFAPQGKSEKEYIAQTIRQLRAWFEDTETWMRAFPERTCIFSFDEMKRDLPALVKRIFAFLELDVSDADIQAQCEAHSYQAYAKRKEGESGETVRTAYMWRKGVSGDWKNHFDLELRQHFEDVCGAYLRLWGYESDASWVQRGD